MRTLYDLLGALPEDDAESLRAAFRKAAKANHPDNNPGDPNAPQRFRRIVRANAILSDERQRATYDRLLEIALQQQSQKRVVSSAKIRKLGSEGIASAVFGLALIAAYLVYGQLSSGLSLIPAPPTERSARAPAQAAAVGSAEQFDRLVGDGPGEKETAEPTKEVNVPGDLERPIAPNAIAPADTIQSDSSNLHSPRSRNFGRGDAKYYSERGIEAYRTGDLHLALIDFDLAISFDPTFADAYIDRGIVLRRLGDLKRAIADIAQAKRIEDSNRKDIPVTENAR
jgi:curved DNA-binding protein CbpA